jgi:hypothetical protein
MSMIGYYRRLTSEELSQLIAGSSVSEFLYPDSDKEPDTSRELDIDKTWHAIHFLLNDSAWEGEDPLAWVVLGGELLGTEDVGYGPARYLLPEQVKSVAAALDEIPEWELRAKFDAERMNEEEIYPQSWAGESADMDYIGEHYQYLVRFFREAANANDALLMYVA